MAAEKNTQPVKVYCNETLELELRRLADADGGRSLSDYARLVLHRHVFGHRPMPAENPAGPDQPD